MSKSGRRPRASMKNNISQQPEGKDLISREEEYKRVNAELEAKTATLVREAEEVMKEQEAIFQHSRLLDNINTDEFLQRRECRRPKPLIHLVTMKSFQFLKGGNTSASQTFSIGFSLEEDAGHIIREFHENCIVGSNENIAARSSSRPVSQSRSRLTVQTRPLSRSKTTVVKKKASTENVAVPKDTFVTEHVDFSLQKTFNKLEEEADSATLLSVEDHLFPISEIGSEASIRFLKAKLRVMQEELDHISQDCRKKDDIKAELQQRIKELEEERKRLQKTNSAQQSHIEKYKKMADDTKIKVDGLENEVAAQKRELELLKRNEKQHSSSRNVTEVRLNRALEEMQKLKDVVQKTKTEAKELNAQNKKRVEHLLAENQRLEKQKGELMSGFKKELKLIDILKRQKMHIEAAKMLSFTEEEFIKAMEWES